MAESNAQQVDHSVVQQQIDQMWEAYYAEQRAQIWEEDLRRQDDRDDDDGDEDEPREINLGDSPGGFKVYE